MMKNIAMKEWLRYHPYKEVNACDHYYLEIANEIHRFLNNKILKKEFSPPIRRKMSLTIAAYFEDVISDIGLWRTFVRNHKKLYGKYLPFYKIDEDNYSDKQINPEDIYFLFWSVIQYSDMKKILNPENILFLKTGDCIYEILKCKIEDAPVNGDFLKHIHSLEIYESFTRFSKLCFWVYYNSFLLESYGHQGLYEWSKEVLDEKDKLSQKLILLYAAFNEAVFNSLTGPLALPLKEWLKGMLENTPVPDISEYVNKLKSLKLQSFLIKSEDEEYFLVQDEKERTFRVIKSSFQDASEFTPGEAFMGHMIKYRGVWHVDGLCVPISKDDYEKNKEEEELQKSLRQFLYNLYMKENENHPLCYYSQDDLSKWVSLREDSKDIVDELFERVKYLAFYADLGAKGMLLDNFVTYIKDPRNPYYNQSEAEKYGLTLIVDKEACSGELLKFLIENDFLPEIAYPSAEGKERGKELLKENIGFIVRFFRRESL